MGLILAPYNKDKQTKALLHFCSAFSKRLKLRLNFDVTYKDKEHQKISER